MIRVTPSGSGWAVFVEPNSCSGLWSSRSCGCAQRCAASRKSSTHGRTSSTKMNCECTANAYVGCVAFQPALLWFKPTHTARRLGDRDRRYHGSLFIRQKLHLLESRATFGGSAREVGCTIAASCPLRLSSCSLAVHVFDVTCGARIALQGVADAERQRRGERRYLRRHGQIDAVVVSKAGQGIAPSSAANASDACAALAYSPLHTRFRTS